MEDFKISQLTKELVVVRLKNMGDPCAAAAELVKKTLWVALKGLKPEDVNFTNLVREACHGGMTGLVLMEQNLPNGAVRMLEAVGEVATGLGLDPTQAMQGCLEGIAELHRVISAEQMEGIRREIDVTLMGAGEAFYAILNSQAQAPIDKP